MVFVGVGMCLKLAGLDEVCTGSPILCFLSIMRVCFPLKVSNGCFSERVQPVQRALGACSRLYVGFEPKAAISVPLMVFKYCLCSKEQGALLTQWRACLGQAVFARSGLRLGSCLVWPT